MSDVTREGIEGVSKQRALAPDLARGVMLLIIAVVHALMAKQVVGPVPQSGVDIGATLLVTLFGESRGYPMFAALFGYGLTLVYARSVSMGAVAPLRPIRLRGRWLIAIGLAHTVLLAYGDILSVYGLAALLFAGLLAADDRRVAMTGGVALIAGTIAYTLVMETLFAAAAQYDVSEMDALTDGLMRLGSWPVSVLAFLAISLFPITMGILAGRRRMLEEVARYRPLLRRVAAGGIVIAVLGGMPRAMSVIGWWEPGGVEGLFAAWLHLVSGYAGGFGYAALIALVAERVGTGRGPIVTALAAAGRMSMTCYLLQSVAWAILFLPYTLDLARSVSHAQAVMIGVGVWLATVLLADGLQRRGLPGPAEAFLRKRLGGSAGRMASQSS